MSTQIRLFQKMLLIYLSNRDLDEVAIWFMALTTEEQQDVLTVLELELDSYQSLYTRLNLQGEDRKQKDKDKEKSHDG